MVSFAPDGDDGIKRKGESMDRSIVCGVDGSADSQAALAVAIELAARLRLRLILANVVEPSQAPFVGAPLLGGPMPRPLLPTFEQQEDAAHELLAEFAATMGAEEAERRVVVGYAAERLADLADEERAEIIVVGSRGRGAFKAAFLGSVSTSLIGVARCPVLVVPPGVADIAIGVGPSPRSRSRTSRDV
jgi:nucleotide-binding universal stress UspA family protein